MEIGTEASNFFSENICFEFSVLCLCSEDEEESDLNKDGGCIVYSIQVCELGLDSSVGVRGTAHYNTQSLTSMVTKQARREGRTQQVIMVIVVLIQTGK